MDSVTKLEKSNVNDLRNDNSFSTLSTHIS